MKILAIGAHPDDVELGCGATLCKHVHDGDQVAIIIVTNGDGQDEVDWHQRIDEARASANKLDAAVHFCGAPEMQYDTVCHSRVRRIENEIHGRYDVAYIHTDHDTHQVHRVVAGCSVVACRDVPRVLSFELPSTTGGWVPNTYSRVTGYMAEKLALLDCYVSQRDKHFMQREVMSALALTRAYQSRIGLSKPEAAEAFKLERMIT